MMASTQPGRRSKHVREAYKAQALMNHCRASGTSGHAVNFARGVFIGAIIVLFILLNVG
jgi:hypothetical protein